MDLPFDFTLFSLFAKASRIIVEFSPDHLPTKELFALFEKNFEFQMHLKLNLDFSGNDFGDLKGSSPVFSKRMLYVLSTSKE